MIRISGKGVFISVGLLFVAAVIFVIVLSLTTSQSSDKSGRIEITNFSKYVNNLPSSEKVTIEKDLYTTVSLNIGTEKANLVDTAVIRDVSYQQRFDNKVYSTTFIVDIESIQQSYRVNNYYSKLSVKESGLFDYTNSVLCVNKDELKYKAFSCKDRISEESNVSSSDPILLYLPYSTLRYDLVIDSSSKDLRLIAKFNLTEADYTIGEQKAIENYKGQLRDWFVSKDLNINNYSITYKY